MALSRAVADHRLSETKSEWGPAWQGLQLGRELKLNFPASHSFVDGIWRQGGAQGEKEGEGACTHSHTKKPVL